MEPWNSLKLLKHHCFEQPKYAANLRRELPRIPISPDFWAISEAGKKLADLHVNYETAKEYPLVEEWRPGAGLNLRVEKMKLRKPPSRDPSTPLRSAQDDSKKRKKDVAPQVEDSGLYDIIYNSDLTLRGIPVEAFEYRLGNRSAIDWIIDQYQVSTDKRSGITNDPNRADDEMYIVNLIRKVVTVSLETVKIVKEIEKLSLG
jgi:predicted helicase